MKFNLIASAILVAITVTSCSHDNTNNLANLDPTSNEYKQELAKLIDERGDKDLTFTFNHCVTVAGKDYLDISVDGRGGLHANSLVLVNNWTKLEGIKRTKGIGYSGAELKNLKLSLVNADTKPTFVYRDLDKIVD